MTYATEICLTSESYATTWDLFRIANSEEPTHILECEIKSTAKEQFEEFLAEMEKKIEELCQSREILYRKISYVGDKFKRIQFINRRNPNTEKFNLKYNFCIEFETSTYGNTIDMMFICNDTTKETALADFFFHYAKNERENVKVNHTSKVHIIYKDEYGLSLKPFKIKKNSENDITIEELYNEDFLEVSKRIEHALSSSNDTSANGITLLHGDVGTGKTSYLRHLIRTINKKIIYLPPDLSVEISSPAFISFLMEHPNSILIIEDAETVLKTREAGGNQAVSNILNMSDGILGDALSLQIICTFNADIEDIDKALLREGRLIDIYSFTALSEERTRNLYTKLYDRAPPDKEMTLAQIFNDDQYNRNKNKEEKPSFGFI